MEKIKQKQFTILRKGYSINQNFLIPQIIFIGGNNLTNDASLICNVLQRQ
jgi:hypothetical protein